MAEQQTSEITDEMIAAAAEGGDGEEPQMNETVRAFLKKLEVAREMDLDIVDPKDLQSTGMAGVGQDQAQPRDQQESDRPAAASNRMMMNSSNEEQLISQLYQNEDFQVEKQQIENQISKASQATAENRNFLGEMDSFLKDLENWKLTRQRKQEQT